MQSFQIISFKDPVLAARLITLGIYPGKTLKIIRKAMFGGAYYIEVDQCHFALRENEIQQMELRATENEVEE
ncbi:MAG: ferrous iron transport protein A [Saprospiraceae bacterium]|nr:ferrous iron transport protein A [Saprospiraceae bacterium]MBK8451679.1 ferrous iron transport protein A [Saprospiraceae bacterium]MBK8486127.1 ferrous iron transport protein A [Saprospiraceae bacterium]MBK9221145.1 ferrous iron transport protein A [Saprospiraceae bacterium]MBK9721930.1 ferrous iron transport protein A [Saprospiraceae bacterium]